MIAITATKEFTLKLYSLSGFVLALNGPLMDEGQARQERMATALRHGLLHIRGLGHLGEDQ